MMKNIVKKLWLIIFFIGTSAGLTIFISCTFLFNSPPSVEKIKIKDIHVLPQSSNGSFVSMGTIWKFSVDSDKHSLQVTSLTNSLLKIAKKYDETFSDWSDKSELRVLENKGLEKKQSASPLFLRGLKYAEDFYQKTSGVFDITIGSYLWLDMKHVGLSNLCWSSQKDIFWFKIDPMRLTFDGFVKGMALGEISHFLYERGIQNFYVNAGNGNAVYAGDYINIFSVNLRKAYKIVFYAASYALQESEGGLQQHIYNTRSYDRIPSDPIRILLPLEGKLTLQELRYEGAYSDMLSTYLVIAGKKTSLARDIIFL